MNHTNLVLSQYPPVLIHAVAAILAETVSGFIWTPLENLKQSLQINSSVSNYPIRNTSLLRLDGITRLFKGYWMTLFAFVPYSIVYFTTFEMLKSRSSYSSQSPPFSSSLISEFSRTLLNASMAASLAAVLSSPMDFLKTRWQLSVTIYGGAITFPRFMKENIRIFFKSPSVLLHNALLRCLWMTPSVALSISIFETLVSSWCVIFAFNLLLIIFIMINCNHILRCKQTWFADTIQWTVALIGAHGKVDEWCVLEMTSSSVLI